MDARVAFVTVLLAATALAGCLRADEDAAMATAGPDLSRLSEPRHGVLPVEEVWTQSSVDGKRIHNALYRPDTDEPVPVFINFSPYWGDTATQEGDRFAQYMIHEYVPRGFAVVLSAVRGTGHSEGCFQIGSDLELQDAYDVVEAFAKQPWASGRVAAGGKSYDSTTQNGLIAKKPHEALKAIFHVSGITDMYRYNYRNGVPYGHGPWFNTYYFLNEGLDEYGLGVFGPPPFLIRPTAARPDGNETPDSLRRVADDAACSETPEMQASGAGSGVHGMKTPYWVERDWTRSIGASSWRGGVFFVHGLQDWNVKPDHILPWVDALPDGVEVKAWLHQWDRRPEGGHVYPMRDDWNVTMLRWLDHYLKGIDTGLLDEPRFEAQGSDGAWRASDAWPPEDALVAAATGIPLEGFEPRATPTYTAYDGIAFRNAGPAKVRVAGVPTMTVRAASLHGDPVLAAQMWVVNGTDLSEARSPEDERFVNEAMLRGVLRSSLEYPTPVQPGVAYDYALGFYPMDLVLEPDQSIRLTIGAPPLRGRPLPDQLAGIAYDLATAQIHLPFAPADAVAAEQPAWVDCFAC